MKTAYAIALCLLITFSVLQGWLVLGVASAVLFSLYFNTAFLIPLAILIDGYMGSFHSVPMLSLAIVAWYGFVEYLRPRFANYSSA
ncbi:MAG: hypothetical protein LR008_01415 [Candidatus Pacebacteria bacterium]|nr:hypothetical protein [Candidatus Paceibacterota bacterium]